MNIINKIKAKIFNSKFPMVGIDISDNSIEFLQLKAGSDKPQIKSSWRQVLKAGLVKNGEIIELEKLAEILKQAFNAAQPKFSTNNCLLSLPDKQTYFLTLRIKEKVNNLGNKIKELAQEKLPVDLALCSFDYLLTHKDEHGQEIFFAAAAKKVIEQYQELFIKAGLNLAVMEFESASLVRALLEGDDLQKSVLIIDLGAVSTDVILHDQHGFRDQLNLVFGGYKITKKISEILNLEFKEAEQLKKKQGLLLTQNNLDKILAVEFSDFWPEIMQIKLAYEKRTGQKVEKLILAGGASLLPGLPELFSQNLPELKIEMGDPSKKIDFYAKTLKNDKIIYSNVIGLALRGLNKESLDQGINLIKINK
ncbi:MAG: pilus assembly protein PilM [Candidatus Parcubacteria bacterium]|nr:pilus assembly protein PilM [Candidatus Parcubacteria bacterium]